MAREELGGLRDEAVRLEETLNTETWFQPIRKTNAMPLWRSAPVRGGDEAGIFAGDLFHECTAALPIRRAGSWKF